MKSLEEWIQTALDNTEEEDREFVEGCIKGALDKEDLYFTCLELSRFIGYNIINFGKLKDEIRNGL